MSDELKAAAEAVEKLNKGFEAFKEANDANIKARDAVTEAKLAKIEEALDKYQKAADDAVLAAKRKARVVTDASGNEIDLDAKALAWANSNARARGERVTGFGAAELNGYKSAFERFARKGEQHLGAEELKALSVGSDPDGGYFVSPDMSGRMVEKVYETSPMRAYASVQVISTDALKGVYDNDEVDVYWEGETEAPTEGGTPQVGEWRIPVNEMRTLVKASQQVIEDAAVNVEMWLADKVAAKMARAENAMFVTGNGVGRPRGLLSYANSTDLTAGIEQITTGVNGAFAAAPAGGDVLINALYALKAQYRANATWFMNRATLKLVRKIKDSNGAYLWSPGIAAGQPATILGYAAASFEDMPDPATGSLSIAVGDMRQAYQIVDRLGVSILRDPYSYKPWVGFYARKRVGGGVVNGEAVKLINFSA